MTRERVIVAAVAAAVFLVWIAPAMDRASRSQQLDGIFSAAAVHVSPDGRLVVTETGGGGSPNGRVLLVDPQTDGREIVLDGLWEPRGADMAADGTVCVVLGGPPPGEPELRCSDGRRVDLSQVDGRSEARVQPRDVVWDGGSGWLIADPGSRSLLRVAQDGAVELVARFEALPGGDPAVPVGLARSSDMLWVALLTAGVTVSPLDSLSSLDASSSAGRFKWVGGDPVVAAIPRSVGEILLHQGANDPRGWVDWCCRFHGERDMILDGLLRPSGLALLPDGRLAVSADGRVTLYRADSLPGS